MTEVEVTFREQEAGGTLVDLVHRHLERYGDAVGSMRDVLDSPDGWAGILAQLLAAASEPSS